MPGIDVGLPVADYLYRCARESISNAMRHGGATEIEISLALNSDHLELTVADNGIGFGEHASSSGLGLRMITHRARLIGGTVQMRRASLGGAAISIMVPLSRLNDAQEIHRH